MQALKVIADTLGVTLILTGDFNLGHFGDLNATAKQLPVRYLENMTADAGLVQYEKKNARGNLLDLFFSTVAIKEIVKDYIFFEYVSETCHVQTAFICKS